MMAYKIKNLISKKELKKQRKNILPLMEKEHIYDSVRKVWIHRRRDEKNPFFSEIV